METTKGSTVGSTHTRLKNAATALRYSTLKLKTNLAIEIEASIKESVKIDIRTRIYIIFLGKGRLGKGRKVKGRFLFGQRKAAPWAGYAPTAQTEDDEDEDSC
jgi:hypothetical protein